MSESLEIAYLSHGEERLRVGKRVVDLSWAVSPRVSSVGIPIAMHPPYASIDEPILHVHAEGRSAITHLYRVFRQIMITDTDDQRVRADVVHEEFRAWVHTYTTISHVTDAALEAVVSDREAPLVNHAYYPGIAARRHAYLFTIKP